MDLECRIRELHAAHVSRKRAAQLVGVPYGRFCLMIETMGLDWMPGLRGKEFKLDGIMDTMSGHAKRLGMSRGALRWRLGRNRAVEAPVRAPISQDEVTRFVDLRRQGVRAFKAAALIGRPYNSLRLAALRLCPDYEYGSLASACAGQQAGVRPMVGDLSNAA